MTSEQEQFVEDLTRYLETWMFLPRIAGRIYATLATSAGAPLTQRVLADQLNVSLASVSSMCRLLCDRKLVERVPVPGSRSEHYAVARRPMHWRLEETRQQVAAFADLARRGAALAGSATGRSVLHDIAETQRVLMVAIDAALGIPPVADSEGAQP